MIVSVEIDHPELGQFTASADVMELSDGTVVMGNPRIHGLAPLPRRGQPGRRPMVPDDEIVIRRHLEKALVEQLKGSAP